MPPGRRIWFSPDCDKAAERLGGYRRVDRSLDAFWDGLSRDPYGFPKIETDWFSIRYIITESIGTIPSLIWFFTIESGDVTLTHVEEHETY